MQDDLVNKADDSLQTVLVDDCDFELFYKVVAYAERELNISFKNKVDDIDSLYFDFEYERVEFMLSYHVYFGIRLELVSKESRSGRDKGIMEKVTGELLRMFV